MSSAEPRSAKGESTLIERVIELAVVAVFVVWCFQIARPFIVPVLWGMIIAVALYPLFSRLRSMLGGKSGLSATVFVVIALAIVIGPTYYIGNSLLETGVEIGHRLEGTKTPYIPPPGEEVKGWPLVGERVYDAWLLASEDTEGALKKYEKQLKGIAGRVLALISGVGGAVMQSLFAIIIAGIFLATADGGKRTALAIGARLGSDTGKKAVSDAGATISSVAKGVLGVALVQGLMAAIGMFLMGVPAWGLWTVGVMILAVIQLPPILLLAPICAWAFSVADGNTGPIIFTIYCLVVSAADGFLKPIFLGRGVEIPMPVILIGAIGGMISMGIIGLFLGAVVLSIGYSMFRVWLGLGLSMVDDGDDGEAAAAGASA
jgi:predicted PurR-regulated permease PerM